jgi:hypothetical protein
LRNIIFRYWGFFVVQREKTGRREEGNNGWKERERQKVGEWGSGNFQKCRECMRPTSRFQEVTVDPNESMNTSFCEVKLRKVRLGRGTHQF